MEFPFSVNYLASIDNRDSFNSTTTYHPWSRVSIRSKRLLKAASGVGCAL